MNDLITPTPGSHFGEFINILKVNAVFAVLYMFLVSIGMISAGFKGLGRGFAEELIFSKAGPLIGLFIGILATSLIQSSSTTTSIVVVFSNNI